MSVKYSSYERESFREVECDRLVVAGQEVRPGADLGAQVAASVPLAEEAREVLVRHEPDCRRCPATKCFDETTPAGALFYWDGERVAPVLPPQEAKHTCLFGLRCRPGVAPELYPLDERAVDVSSLEAKVAALEQKIAQLAAAPPKKTPARRGRPAKKVSTQQSTDKKE